MTIFKKAQHINKGGIIHLQTGLSDLHFHQNGTLLKTISCAAPLRHAATKRKFFSFLFGVKIPSNKRKFMKWKNGGLKWILDPHSPGIEQYLDIFFNIVFAILCFYVYVCMTTSSMFSAMYAFSLHGPKLWSMNLNTKSYNCFTSLY